jgi:hypothetical protein
MKHTLTKSRHNDQSRISASARNVQRNQWRNVGETQAILGKACSKSDYENWEAHEDLKLKNNKSEERCQLGKKTTYKKLKKVSK